MGLTLLRRNLLMSSTILLALIASDWNGQDEWKDFWGYHSWEALAKLNGA